jgi:hypothetical protein
LPLEVLSGHLLNALWIALRRSQGARKVLPGLQPIAMQQVDLG